MAAMVPSPPHLAAAREMARDILVPCAAGQANAAAGEEGAAWLAYAAFEAAQCERYREGLQDATKSLKSLEKAHAETQAQADTSRGMPSLFKNGYDELRRQRNAGQRKSGDDGDEAFFTPRPQVAQRDHALEGVEDHPVSRASADSAEISSRSPLARSLNSTTPFLIPRGPTMICHGTPIRSMSANFAPARSLRSS